MGKMFDHLSHKFHKHQIKEMKLFRINIDKNEIPLLGEFNGLLGPKEPSIIKNNGACSIGYPLVPTITGTLIKLLRVKISI